MPSANFHLDWKRELASSYRTAADLFKAGLINETEKTQLHPVLGRYQFLLPRYYADLIDKNDADCPIRLQSIPSLSELNPGSGYLPDPLGDLSHQPVDRVTHRYPDRLLVHLTSNCSMYCRFCFRKTLLNELRDALFDGNLEQAFGYVKKQTTVQEVIFSGGDPFLANTTTIQLALQRFGALPHLKRLRFHTRVPVTFPMRIDDELVQALTHSHKPVVVVTHFNHPKEITDDSAAACRRLLNIGVIIFNQSVLLKGVNDSADKLIALSERLFEIKVIPYYLHHHDRPEGTVHFEVSAEQGLAIYREMRARMAGYLVPRYVIEVPGSPYKKDMGEVSRLGLMP